MIPYGKQDISQADIDSVVAVLQSDFLTQGPQVPAFEQGISNQCNAKYGVAVNSATSALHIACLALGLGAGDILWTSPNTFAASANCGLYCGATVDFVDIDPLTYNLCSTKLQEKLEQAVKTGKLPKVVVPVHFAGQSCNMKRIHELSVEYGFKIIEDASHAIGAKYLNEPVGNCRYSDICVFSFHPVKIITTAEGGLATTNDEQLAETMGLLRSHGISREPHLLTREADGGWYYEQIDLGFNYRMTELQAALGVSQLRRVDQFVERRNQLYQQYQKPLSALPITLPYTHPDNYSALHLYPIQLNLDDLTKSKTQVFDELRAAGLGVNLHYIPVHTHPYYEAMGFKTGDFPVSEAYYQRAISIPLFHAMTEAEQDQVVQILRSVLI